MVNQSLFLYLNRSISVPTGFPLDSQYPLNDSQSIENFLASGNHFPLSWVEVQPGILAIRSIYGGLFWQC